MQIDLEELQPKLKEATIATDALLVQIARDTEVANEKKAVVEKEVRVRIRKLLMSCLLLCPFLLAGVLISTPHFRLARRKLFATHKQRNQEP